MRKTVKTAAPTARVSALDRCSHDQPGQADRHRQRPQLELLSHCFPPFTRAADPRCAGEMLLSVAANGIRFTPAGAVNANKLSAGLISRFQSENCARNWGWLRVSLYVSTTRNGNGRSPSAIHT